MPVAKLKGANATDVMKSEEGNDSLDTFIRQAMGKEPLLSFPRTNDSPVQWIQLLQALDQQDGPGWPLLTPLKVQMQKCDKCSREFCSSINYRRHIRVHHRLKKLDKDTTKNRNLLGAFWEKLSEDEAKEILSFKDVALEEVSGSSIIKSLMALNRKQGFSPLPQYCLRAGTALLDIIQGRFRYPLSSEELFSILDDASEKTFLCGAAISMQKYIFDGEAAKTGLETKNIVACTSFLVEQKLIKAWVADKDAEALRCQKLLVEEEEAAQRRQAELVERKRQKKLRQKEQRAKEQRLEEKPDIEEHSDETMEEPPAELPCSTACSSNSHDVEIQPDPFSSSSEPLQLTYQDEELLDLENQILYDTGAAGDPCRDYFVERHTTVPGCNRSRHVGRWHVPPKSQWNHITNGYHGTYRDPKQAAMVNGNRKWSRKARVEYATGETLKPRVDREAAMTSQQPDHHAKKREVLIGSISVALGNSSQQDGQADQQQQVPRKSNNNVQDKHSNRSTVKQQWRPVSRNGTKGQPQDESGSRESPDGSLPPGRSQFSCQAAKAFLAERWKEAMAAEHVKLVLAPEPFKAGKGVQQNGCAVTAESSDVRRGIELGTRGSEEDMMVDGGAGLKGKFRAKPEKGVKLKYIPKQRTLS
ncbi:unnamed protein product [Linum tenue]|uniref:C2H2-type domain-containing protein n=1 Tax=Linum tenue TaxID=586396 RepID=A0AAV0J3L2_9ROSI|nr:unnamed protein product [Linum tenue]